MWRTLRAFAWMRWRVLMNSLDRTTARDTLERFSLAIEQIGPFIAFGLLAPSAVALAGIAGYAGYWLPSSDRVLTFEALRLLLLVSSGLSIIGPILMPSLERTSAVRLLLLPIPRRTLYLAQAATALSDPWIILAIPIVLALPIGAAMAGAFGVAAAAFAGGLLLVVLLVGLSALSTLVLQLIVRDRRRGEWVALIVMLLPMLFMLPGLMDASRSREQRRADRQAAVERRQRGEESLPELALRAGQRAFTFLPSELFATAARAPSSRGAAGAATPLFGRAGAAAPLLGLAAIAVLIHGLGLLTFGRLLDSPLASSRRQAVAATNGRGPRIPGLSRSSGAVALAQFRLATRTPRGRAILLTPFLVFVMFTLVLARRGMFEIGLENVSPGLGLAAFGSLMCMLGIHPFAMNQFAIDRAGLTLALLAPISTRDFLTGKAVGNALIVGGPSLLCVLVAYSVFHDAPIGLWLTVPLAMLANFALMAPAAAALSAIFPRHVDLNSIGRGSNPHSVAGLVGLLVFLLSGLPGGVIAIASIVVFKRPMLTFALMLAWCLLALGMSRLLFRPVAVVFDKRRENLGLVAS